MRGHFHRRDKEVTKAAGFLDRRSHITLATHHGPAKTYLFGKDVEAQRARIWHRDGRICVDCAKALDISAGILADNSMHRAHVLSRARGGDDSDSNIKAKCPGCHFKNDHGWGKKL